MQSQANLVIGPRAIEFSSTLGIQTEGGENINSICGALLH